MLLREKAYEKFTERLLSRDIQPGQFVSQRELVAITGFALGAIREMIPRLQADGLIRTVPNRGLQVAHVDLALIRNAFQLRSILECEAVQNFTQRASNEEIADLRAQHEAIIAGAKGGATEQLVANAQTLDWDMHDALIDALGNELISDIYRVNSIKIRLIRQRETRIEPEMVISVMQEHMRIIDAIEARDVAAAVSAMGAHIESARQRALQT
jgi:DNA-binding GntR family transcriptional regulator